MLHIKSYEGTTAEVDEVKGIAHMVISCYGIEDHDGDTMMPGAFAKSIDVFKKGGFSPVGLAYHDTRRPVAKTLDAYEKDNEVHVIGQYNLETQDGREVFSNVKNGIIKQYSHGFIRPVVERKNGKRGIHDLQWKEWSPVAIPALDATYTVGVKGLLRDGATYADQFEMVLAAVEDIIDRTREIKDLRESQDRDLSQKNRTFLKDLHERLASLLSETPTAVAPEDVQAEMVRLIKSQQAFRALCASA